MEHQNKLAGKAILVTGSNTGIGRAIAERCLSEGARVAIHGLDPAAVESVAEELGSKAFGIAGDLALMRQTGLFRKPLSDLGAWTE